VNGTDEESTLVVVGGAKLRGHACVEKESDYACVWPVGEYGWVFTTYRTEGGVECSYGGFSGKPEDVEREIEKAYGKVAYEKEYKHVFEMARVEIS